jgi:tetratricopeptide (TPR) repeat protein
LPSRETTQLDVEWERYESLGSRSLLGVARRQVDGPMRDALATNAERVIADFRHDRPTVRERQWQQARNWLGKALRIDPRNASLTARLRYCEGQLSRIDGEARLQASRRQDADRLLHDAVSRFEEAAQLDRAWPDPWLGLLRTYIYGIEDPARAVEALNEAERRGHRAGRREFTQLGEAHFTMAERGYKECSRLPAEQQCGCLQRASGLYRQSVSWFERAATDADTSRALVRAHERQTATMASMSGLACTDVVPGTAGAL